MKISIHNLDKCEDMAIHETIRPTDNWWDCKRYYRDLGFPYRGAYKLLKSMKGKSKAKVDIKVQAFLDRHRCKKHLTGFYRYMLDSAVYRLRYPDSKYNDSMYFDDNRCLFYSQGLSYSSCSQRNRKAAFTPEEIATKKVELKRRLKQYKLAKRQWVIKDTYRKIIPAKTFYEYFMQVSRTKTFIDRITIHRSKENGGSYHCNKYRFEKHYKTVLRTCSDPQRTVDYALFSRMQQYPTLYKYAIIAA